MGRILKMNRRPNDKNQEILELAKARIQISTTPKGNCRSRMVEMKCNDH